MPTMLYPGEKIYDANNFAELMGDGKRVMAAGEMRLLSRLPPPLGSDPRSFSTPMEDVIQPIPRDQWSPLLKVQLDTKQRVSDFQNFPPHDQDGLPTCWANGPAAAATTVRVIMGLPYVEMSACSVAVPISGGHSGGYEGDALKYSAQHGFASVAVWPNNSTQKSLNNDPAVIADRQNHMALEWIDLGRKFENYATACLNSWPIAVAYNDWSHVVMICDLVEVRPGVFALRIRNNWGKWGAANDYGFYGYAVFIEGAHPHGIPSSGFALRQMTPSPI